MKKIFGFTDASENGENGFFESDIRTENTNAVRSVVSVFFPDRHMTLSYYNDMFNLHKGDLVYVEGKLEGLQGQVVDISYNFKIKLSDYMRVIAVVDSSVSGRFYNSESYFISFDRENLPREKALLWFKAPSVDEEEYVTGHGEGPCVYIDDLDSFDVSLEIRKRGINYFFEDKVAYLSVDKNKGYAIVEGTSVYEVEFDYYDGEITNIYCDCPCCYNCKHEVAALYLLKQELDYIKKSYSEIYTDYFCAVKKTRLMKMLFVNNEAGFVDIN